MFMKWPSFFPAGCPPENAQPSFGEVFRLVKKDPPTSEDFKSHRETQPDKKFDVLECEVCSLSVFRDMGDILNLKKRVPAMRKRLVSQAILNESLGKILHTPSLGGKSHYSWWVPVDVQPWILFHVVKIQQEE